MFCDDNPSSCSPPSPSPSPSPSSPYSSSPLPAPPTPPPLSPPPPPPPLPRRPGLSASSSPRSLSPRFAATSDDWFESASIPSPSPSGSPIFRVLHQRYQPRAPLLSLPPVFLSPPDTPPPPPTRHGDGRRRSQGRFPWRAIIILLPPLLLVLCAHLAHCVYSADMHCILFDDCLLTPRPLPDTDCHTAWTSFHHTTEALISHQLHDLVSPASVSLVADLAQFHPEDSYLALGDMTDVLDAMQNCTGILQDILAKSTLAACTPHRPMLTLSATDLDRTGRSAQPIRAHTSRARRASAAVFLQHCTTSTAVASLGFPQDGAQEAANASSAISYYMHAVSTVREHLCRLALPFVSDSLLWADTSHVTHTCPWEDAADHAAAYSAKIGAKAAKHAREVARRAARATKKVAKQNAKHHAEEAAKLAAKQAASRDRQARGIFTGDEDDDDDGDDPEQCEDDDWEQQEKNRINPVRLATATQHTLASLRFDALRIRQLAYLDSCNVRVTEFSGTAYRAQVNTTRVQALDTLGSHAVDLAQGAHDALAAHLKSVQACNVLYEEDDENGRAGERMQGMMWILRHATGMGRVGD